VLIISSPAVILELKVAAPPVAIENLSTFAVLSKILKRLLESTTCKT
jgi:hypothetical protein